VAQEAAKQALKQLLGAGASKLKSVTNHANEYNSFLFPKWACYNTPARAIRLLLHETHY